MGGSFIRLKGDKGIWIIVILFALISILSVFSASSFLASEGGVAKTKIFLEQSRSVCFGFLALYVCYLIPLRWYRSLAFIVFGISVVMLVLLYIKPCRVEVNGAVRGLKVFGKTVQVFEIAKVGLILYLARALEFWEYDLGTFKDFYIKIALPVFAVCALVVPNSFSSALLFGGVAMLVLIFMDVKWKYILSMVAVVIAVAALYYGTYCALFKGRTMDEGSVAAKVFNRIPTVEKRVARFFSGEEETDFSQMSKEEQKEYIDENRQTINASVAISEGGIFGKGPGKSTQRYSLSMAFSDFIYAFIVEEYGLVGGLVVIALYVIFLFRCIRLCTRCKTIFSGALVVGISFLIITQAMLHILVNVGLMPVTGHTLPLISHGGTAYLVLSGAFGMILSVNKQLDKQDEELSKRVNLKNQQIGNYDEKSKDNY